MKFAKLMVVGILSLNFSVATANSNSCNLFSPRTEKEAWTQSIAAIQQIKQRVYGVDNVIESLVTAMLAKEFAWINGEPGGAKTLLSRLTFQSALNSIPELEKKTFILQFHKLITEGKIIGFQKFKAMMEKGRYEIEKKSALVNDEYLFLIADEAEKANPATLNSLLSVLNERKAFLGATVVEAGLSSGVFTSNKTTGEFVDGTVNDRQAGEALLDRMAIKIHALNQQLGPKETVAMYDLVKNPNKAKITLPLLDLQKLIPKIKISDDLMAEIVKIARQFDRYVTDKWGKSKNDVRWGQSEAEYFPANQFSNRSVRRLVQVFKASIISRQLMEGIPVEHMRLTPRREDLALLVQGAAYGGPASIRPKRYVLTEQGKGVKVASPYGTVSDPGMEALLSPFEDRIYLQNSGGVKFTLGKKDKKWEVIAIDPEFNGPEGRWTVDMQDIDALSAQIEKALKDNNIDLTKPQFEIDTQIDKFIAKGTLKERTRKELEEIKKDTEQFINVLNQHFDNGPVSFKAAKEDFLPARTQKEVRNFRKQIYSADKEERLRRFYEWMSYEVKALKQRFVEMDYAVEAHLTGILSNTHLYVFGPPGGAKTALAETMLNAEIRKLNSDQVKSFVKRVLEETNSDHNFLRNVLLKLQRDPDTGKRLDEPKLLDRFLLQFHPLVPEGVLIGFSKVQKLLDEGIEEIEISTSLANEKFVFAILDEVDKANPQTITTLLSILEEREVFAGNRVIKTALRTAILTSNKMPSELLDSYPKKDRPTGEAIMDRTVNKVYVSNKISSEEELTKFLINLEKGISPSWKGLLAVGELEALVKEVTFEDSTVKEILARVHQNFLALRIKREEETRKAHLMDNREYPDYYVSASTSASNRSAIRYFDLLKSRFIVNQLVNGVPYENLRTKIELKDIGLFLEGMGYWAPQKVGFGYNGDGILEFNRNTETMDRLISSGVVDPRVKYHLEMMLEESRDFVQVLNAVVSEFLVEYKSMIAQYPDLFPSLFIDKKTRDAKTK